MIQRCHEMIGIHVCGASHGSTQFWLRIPQDVHNGHNVLIRRGLLPHKTHHRAYPRELEDRNPLHR